MSVKIRLTRVGRRKAPYFRIAVADSRKARDGRIVESIGHYQPLRPEDTLQIDEARALYWLGQGAQPSDTIRSLFKRKGIMRKFHESRFGPSVKPGHEQYHQIKDKATREAERAAKAAQKTEKAAAEAPAAAPAAAPDAAAPAAEASAQ